jgi:hypothetical protein
MARIKAASPASGTASNDALMLAVLKIRNRFIFSIAARPSTQSGQARIEPASAFMEGSDMERPAQAAPDLWTHAATRALHQANVA